MSIKLSGKPIRKKSLQPKSSRVFKYALVPKPRAIKNCIWEVQLQNMKFAFQGNIVTEIKGINRAGRIKYAINFTSLVGFVVKYMKNS